MKRSFVQYRVLSAFALALLSASAPSLTGAAARAAASASTAEPGAAGKADWDKMSTDERKKLMKTQVLPEMKKTFQAVNPQRYKSFSCATCHGDGATSGTFKMPNPKLPKLPAPTDQAGFMALQQKKPEVFKFMETMVKPKVASILGLPEWSPQNPKGFGCFACHTSQAGK